MFCQDVIGASMAGPGIRYWELARALSASHEVTLAAPNRPDVDPEGFRVVSYASGGMAPVLAGQDVVLTQSVTPAIAFLGRRNDVRIVLDAYDPVLLEGLEIFRADPAAVRAARNDRYLASMRLGLSVADAVICASEKQRDLWLGALMASGRVDPTEYDRDVSLRRLVDVVPFGLQDEPPAQTGPGFRERLGISPSDKVLLWGGGIWNWFDPLTLIRALGLVRAQRSDVKLVFMGLKHPNERVPEMEMAVRAQELAKELGLLGETVHFNYGWVPYGERQNHLLEADLGVTTHFDHLETRFSFRTRVLDYLWAGLPIISTAGDSMADLVTQHGLGRVVPAEDPAALASAITGLLDDPAELAAVRERIAVQRESFRWSRVAQPLHERIQELAGEPAPRLRARDLRGVAQQYASDLSDLRSERGTATIAREVARTAVRLVSRSR